MRVRVPPTAPLLVETLPYPIDIKAFYADSLCGVYNMVNNIGLPGLILILIPILIYFLPLILGLAFMGGQKRINLKHSDSGLNKSGFIGYSWTYFFFGFFVPIFRGEIGIGLMHLIFSIITFGLFHLIMPFL